MEFTQGSSTARSGGNNRSCAPAGDSVEIEEREGRAPNLGDGEGRPQVVPTIAQKKTMPPPCIGVDTVQLPPVPFIRLPTFLPFPRRAPFWFAPLEGGEC